MKRFKTRVPITVATELAESLNPFTKSKISATIIAAIANSYISHQVYFRTISSTTSATSTHLSDAVSIDS